MTKTIKVTSENKGERLDKFLTEYFKNEKTDVSTSVLTRSQIKKIILSGDILVNDKKTSVHYFLKEKDKIKIIPLLSKEGLGEVLKPRFKIDISKPLLISPWKGEKPQINIIKETNDFIIIEKPSGLLVHPTAKNETDTLVDWLVAEYPELIKIGEDPKRAGIVHRLDKEVSGLMIIPRTQDSFDYFKQQFKDHKIIKKYTTLVYGEIEKDKDEINFPIGRSKTKSGLFAAHPQEKGKKFSAKDKPAITTFKVEKRFKNYTLLEIEIFTGRTHQIRGHLTAYVHPIVGDKLYKTRKQENKKTRKQIDRIFLHAKSLSFIGLDGKQYKFTSKLPKELDEFLLELKL